MNEKRHILKKGTLRPPRLPGFSAFWVIFSTQQHTTCVVKSSAFQSEKPHAPSPRTIDLRERVRVVFDDAVPPRGTAMWGTAMTEEKCEQTIISERSRLL
jgi:hypothetical protein